MSSSLSPNSFATLRAKFEQERNQSPAGARGPSAISTEAGGPQPRNKIRTSFVTVGVMASDDTHNSLQIPDQNGAFGLDGSVGSKFGRKVNNSTNSGGTNENVDKSASASETKNLGDSTRHPQSTSLSESSKLADSTIKTSSPGSLDKTPIKSSATIRKSKPDSPLSPIDRSKRADSVRRSTNTATATKTPGSESHSTNSAAQVQAKQKGASVPRGNISTTEASRGTKSASTDMSKVPAATQASDKLPKSVRISTNASKSSDTSSGHDTHVTASLSQANHRATTQRQTSSASTGFVKPKAKSPTRPVKLPAAATKSTTSSNAKHDPDSVAPLPRASSRVSSISTISSSRKSSTTKPASMNTSKGPAHGARASLPAQMKSPPSHLPKQRAPHRASTIGTRQADTNFLDRMMRPTQSSSQKTHDKPDVKQGVPQRPKTKPISTADPSRMRPPQAVRPIRRDPKADPKSSVLEKPSKPTSSSDTSRKDLPQCLSKSDRDEGSRQKSKTSGPDKTANDNVQPVTDDKVARPHEQDLSKEAESDQRRRPHDLADTTISATQKPSPGGEAMQASQGDTQQNMRLLMSLDPVAPAPHEVVISEQTDPSTNRDEVTTIAASFVPSPQDPSVVSDSKSPDGTSKQSPLPNTRQAGSEATTVLEPTRVESTSIKATTLSKATSPDSAEAIKEPSQEQQTAVDISAKDEKLPDTKPSLPAAESHKPDDQEASIESTE